MPLLTQTHKWEQRQRSARQIERAHSASAPPTIKRAHLLLSPFGKVILSSIGVQMEQPENRMNRYLGMLITQLILQIAVVFILTI